MKSIIQIRVYKGAKQYVAESVDLPVVTQGKTLDELMKNIKEVLQLHLQGEDLAELGLSSHPSVLVNFELSSPVHV